MKILSPYDGMACGMIANKMLGNGWTCEVIKHLILGILEEKGE